MDESRLRKRSLYVTPFSFEPVDNERLCFFNNLIENHLNKSAFPFVIGREIWPEDLRSR
jgi:hypothetical protein